MAYIYQITNDVNGKIYIGKTEFSIEKRFKEHCKDAFKERNEQRPLYAAMRKYGTEHFHIEALEETDNPEEREQYWIEKKGSYKHGYNATLGGDGKKYIDWDLVVRTYQEVQNCAQVANILGIDPHTVSKILKARNIEVKSSQQVTAEAKSKPVLMLDKDTHKVIKAFPSLTAAAQFLIDNKMTNCKRTTIHYHITEVCKGSRKTAAGFAWKY